MPWSGGGKRMLYSPPVSFKAGHVIGVSKNWNFRHHGVDSIRHSVVGNILRNELVLGLLHECAQNANAYGIPELFESLMPTSMLSLVILCICSCLSCIKATLKYVAVEKFLSIIVTTKDMFRPVYCCFKVAGSHLNLAKMHAQKRLR